MSLLHHGPILVSMRAIRPLVDALAAAGVPRAAFLRAAALDPSWEQTLDARLPRAKLFDLFDLALALTGDPAFGLHSVEKLTSDAISPIGALVVHASTLREALQSLQEFRRLLADEPSFHIQEQSGKVYVRCRTYDEASTAARRYMDEVAVGGLYLLLRRFTVAVDHVGFAYSPPPYHAEYARVFAGKARFEQSFTELCFDAKWLTMPAPHCDAALHRALTMYASHRIRHLTDGRSWAERVREVLVWQRRPLDMTMTANARKLGVSVRSLRRYLAREGHSYPGLVDEALATIARGCLLDEHRTIMETAHELGFADNTSFHRAFRRWTGLTPMEFRRARTAIPPDTRIPGDERAPDDLY